MSTKGNTRRGKVCMSPLTRPFDGPQLTKSLRYFARSSGDNGGRIGVDLGGGDFGDGLAEIREGREMP